MKVHSTSVNFKSIQEVKIKVKQTEIQTHLGEHSQKCWDNL